ncbi:Tripeptidyl-peptidase II protein [Dioscorea alata]|uniref:Tripeptidyl-peptidase II protein n=1 Tax=Dioscorea alata TaxID=55571 RepID=A0ACB7VH22_DIOAL|nr:Tripeptidyl-peptidase II protein [Dioscorea alata]
MAKSEMPTIFPTPHHWYLSSLSSLSSSPPPILYTYSTILHGFSTRLSPSQASSLRSLSGVLSVLPESHFHLHTTRTPHFLGLSPSTPSSSISTSTSNNIIIGVLDTGVWPESPSFNDAGFSPIPQTWRGTCQTTTTFNSSSCNRKLIGARFFLNGYESSSSLDQTKESRSPRDHDGHGTHTATTIAGSPVPSANLLGYATGTARGMAPQARLAIYKVCWAAGCFGSDILAAMDSAVSDGCHVLSLSLGGGMSPYYLDNVAIGAFSAMEHGVFVSCSAGNDGPTPSTLSNVAPWLTTVGAGTLDRDFPATVYFNNGVNFTGVSLYKGKPLPSSSRLLPFVYAGNVSNGTDGNLCLPGTLNPSLVAGKLVLCERGGNARVEKGYVVKSAGGAGMVLANTEDTGEELIADAHLLPAMAVGAKARNLILSYLSSNPNPTATIVFSGTKVGIRPSPVVAAFSSRGPNGITPEILKPDLIAPGVNILAGWSGSVGPTGLKVDPRRVEFNIISGTSMSCPHVSGLAALIKGAHPEWSPAAIKSALMTTAYVDYDHGNGDVLDAATLRGATPFDYGSGHVDPVRALDPGLVYDLGVEDYVDFLCALGYSPEEIATVAKKKGFKCDGKRTYTVTALNYPSFAVAFETATWSGVAGVVGTTSTITHVRTLTNVGPAGTYKVKVTSEKDVKVKVEPEVLVFKKKGQRVSYKVSFTAGSQPSGSTGFGRLEWTDGKHVVASPIAYTWT